MSAPALRIALVSFFNATPYLDGLARLPGAAVTTLPPAACADAFADGRADAALVPAAALLDLPGAAVLDGWCIGANGRVDSVFLFAQQPAETLRAVRLDARSRTSNGLAQLLFDGYWRRPVEWLAPADTPGAGIDGDVGGVVIGDDALTARDSFRYAYDLAECWEAWQSLPFVFAVWVCRAEQTAAPALQGLRAALAEGVAGRVESARRHAAAYGLTPEKAAHYLTGCIDYALDAPKREALRLYLRLLAARRAQPAHAPAFV